MIHIAGVVWIKEYPKRREKSRASVNCSESKGECVVIKPWGLKEETYPAGTFENLLGKLLTGTHTAWGRREVGVSVLAKHIGKRTETAGNNYIWSQFCCKKQNEPFLKRERKGASLIPGVCGAQERIFFFFLKKRGGRKGSSLHLQISISLAAPTLCLPVPFSTCPHALPCTFSQEKTF